MLIFLSFLNENNALLSENNILRYEGWSADKIRCQQWYSAAVYW